MASETIEDGHKCEADCGEPIPENAACYSDPDTGKTYHVRCAEEPIPVYKVRPAEFDNPSLIVKSLSEAEDHIRAGDPETEWTVEYTTMARIAYDSLPEFGGW